MRPMRVSAALRPTQFRRIKVNPPAALIALSRRRPSVPRLHPVAFAFEIEHVAVMQEAVEHRGGHHVVTEDPAPFPRKLCYS
jgi:hypothetical protein